MERNSKYITRRSGEVVLAEEVETIINASESDGNGNEISSFEPHFPPLLLRHPGLL